MTKIPALPVGWYAEFTMRVEDIVIHSPRLIRHRCKSFLTNLIELLSDARQLVGRGCEATVLRDKLKAILTEALLR